jgi:hypothetical protein
MMEHKVDVVCSVPYTMAQLGREKETGGRFLTLNPISYTCLQKIEHTLIMRIILININKYKESIIIPENIRSGCRFNQE